MERKIGEIFNYYGTTIEVVEQSIEDACAGCYFNSNFMCICYADRDRVGECSCIRRTDKKDVIFKEIEK